LRVRAARYPVLAMTVRKVNLMLDEELVRRARRQDADALGKSDIEVVQDALTFYLGLRALEEARAQGAVDAQEADGLAVQESSGSPSGA
jgi:hypothetical protein